MLEMGQDERGAGDITGLAGAGGDPLEGAPAAFDQGEAAFAPTPYRAQQHVAGTGIDARGRRVVAALLSRDLDGRATRGGGRR